MTLPPCDLATLWIMEITVKTVEGVKVFEVVGDIDGKSAPEVQEKVKAETPPQGKILLDLTKVPYMSSAGLRTMLGVYRHVVGLKGKIALVGVNDEIKETMEITGFLEHFTLCTTVDEGIKALG